MKRKYHEGGINGNKYQNEFYQETNMHIAQSRTWRIVPTWMPARRLLNTAYSKNTFNQINDWDRRMFFLLYKSLVILTIKEYLKIAPNCVQCWGKNARTMNQNRRHGNRALERSRTRYACDSEHRAQCNVSCTREARATQTDAICWKVKCNSVHGTRSKAVSEYRLCIAEVNRSWGLSFWL